MFGDNILRNAALDSGPVISYKRGRTAALRMSPCHGAQVAQLVEQWTENPRVGGSSPPLGTTYLRETSGNSLNLKQLGWLGSIR